MSRLVNFLGFFDSLMSFVPSVNYNFLMLSLILYSQVLFCLSGKRELIMPANELIGGQALDSIA